MDIDVRAEGTHDGCSTLCHGEVVVDQIIACVDWRFVSLVLGARTGARDCDCTRIRVTVRSHSDTPVTVFLRSLLPAATATSFIIERYGKI